MSATEIIKKQVHLNKKAAIFSLAMDNSPNVHEGLVGVDVIIRNPPSVLNGGALKIYM